MSAGVQIRDEQPRDVASIQRVHREAFGGDVEVRLVDLLRERHKALVSLVAVMHSEVVGHILFSPVTIGDAGSSVRSAGLAPVAVLPDAQKTGIGSSLIREGLDRCRRIGYGVVVVLGDPAYYSRFGFRAATAVGLQNEYGVGDEFMVLELTDGAVDEVSGLVRYAPEFKEADAG